MRTVKSSISPNSTLKKGGTVSVKKNIGVGSGAVTGTPKTTVSTGVFQNVNSPKPLSFKPTINTFGSKRGRFTS